MQEDWRFSGMSYYKIDMMPPLIQSVNRDWLADEITAGDYVVFTVTFSKVVTGVSLRNFSIDATGDQVGATIYSIGGCGRVWQVTVKTHYGAGRLSIDLNRNLTLIRDEVNLFPTYSFSDGESYQIRSMKIYVDYNRGYDTNCGSSDKPMKTIGAGIEKVMRGGTIYVRRHEPLSKALRIPIHVKIEPDPLYVLYVRIGTDTGKGDSDMSADESVGSGKGDSDMSADESVDFGTENSWLKYILPR